MNGESWSRFDKIMVIGVWSLLFAIVVHMIVFTVVFPPLEALPIMVEGFNFNIRIRIRYGVVGSIGLHDIVLQPGQKINLTISYRIIGVPISGVKMFFKGDCENVEVTVVMAYSNGVVLTVENVGVVTVYGFRIDYGVGF